MIIENNWQVRVNIDAMLVAIVRITKTTTRLKKLKTICSYNLQITLAATVLNTTSVHRRLV